MTANDSKAKTAAEARTAPRGDVATHVYEVALNGRQAIKPDFDRDHGFDAASARVTEEERATAWLGKVGLRPTRQRLTLARLLIGDGNHRHVTAESLFEAVKTAGAAVSLATVYNTLRAFCDVGLMQEVTVDGSKSYFDTNTHDHPHFFWEDQARLTDAPSDQLVIARLPDAPEGAEIASVDVVIRLRRK